MKTKLAILLTSAFALATIADTNPCYTQVSRVFYPQGPDAGVKIYSMVTPTSAGPELKIWNQSVAYYDLTFRVTTIIKGVTNQVTEFRPKISALGSSTMIFSDNQSFTAQKSTVVPWSSLCNLRGNSGQIEMWVCPVDSLDVLSYGIVRVDSN